MLAVLVRWLAEKYLRVAVKRCRSNHDKKVRSKPTYAPADYVLVDRLSLTTSAAEHLAADVYSKNAKRHGLYRVLSMRPGYLMVLQEGVKSSFSINRVTGVA